MYRVLARLAVLSAAFAMPLPSIADLVGDPHIDIGAINLGGGLIQYTIDMHNPFGGAVAVEMAATGNINQIDTDGVTVIIPPIGEVVLLPPGEVNFEDEASIADGDPTYAGLGGSAADSWWDRSLLSTPNPPFGGAQGGEVGSTLFQFSAGSPAGSDIAITRVGQLVVFDAMAAGLPLGPQPVGESGFAQWSFVDQPTGQPSKVAAAGLTFSVNGSFAVGPPLPPSLSAELDIRPGTDQNSVNLKSRGVLPVALLTTAEFDALQVDLASIVFGDPLLLNGGATGVAPLRSGEKDVNRDGLTDLTLKFSMRDLVDNGALGGMSIEAILTGLTFDGMPFEGADSIRLVPPGDANNDQIVNAGDYIIWANNFGTNGASTPGDFDENNHVDAGDYITWANNFGTNLSARQNSAAAVPEPSTLVLSALGLVGLFACARRRRRRA